MEKKRRSGFGRLFVVLLILGLVGLNAYQFAGRKETTEATITNLRLEHVGELATQAAYYTGIDSINDGRTVSFFNKEFDVPFTKNHYIYSYNGTLKAGINFEEVECHADLEKKMIVVTMPKAKIISNEIDNNSLKVYIQQENIFTPAKIERFNDSQIKLKNEAETQAMENGLIQEAEKNAKMLITGFLAASFDLNEYRIIFGQED